MQTQSDAANKVPMMFRAQVDGRCQLQRLMPQKTKQDAQYWADEWVDKAYATAPEFGADVQTRTYEISWRFITNSGQDDGVIRPVIGAKGWPFYPGSSMKGLFRQACQAAEKSGEIAAGSCDRYCGNEDDITPGILRFHGGYPTDTRWTQDLVDIVHPQQDWQVKTDRKPGGAFIQISLHKPELKFGISSKEKLSETTWQDIWQVWEKALAMGIGSRVSAGYGQPEQTAGDILYRTQLKGQGQAPKLITGKEEFRPNVFRAAIRGHAMRIFGGLADARTAEDLVEGLFGGIQGGATPGLLSMAFIETRLDLSEFGSGSYAQPTYDVEGELRWMLTRSISKDARKELTKLIKALTRFAMVLGGFGKSWRRVDHRLVYPDYYREGYKPLIGCHWQWVDPLERFRDVRVHRLNKVGSFIDAVRKAAKTWMQLQGITPSPNYADSWREAWHPDTVQVWGRLADDIEDCEAVAWLHGPYEKGDPAMGIPTGSIYQTTLTGEMGHIGRLWHRMYPFVLLKKNPKTGDPVPKPTRNCFELLTLFPDDSPKTLDFLDFLENHHRSFQKLWPLPK